MQILKETQQYFGLRQVPVYANIIEKALEMLAEDPIRPAILDQSDIRPGLRSFHLALAAGRRRGASHKLFFAIRTLPNGEPELHVFRVLHDAMEPKRRMIGGFRQLNSSVDITAHPANVPAMKRDFQINACWDDEAIVWLATSDDVIGLCVEAATWGKLIDAVQLILPDLMPLNGQSIDGISLTFKAEAHLDLARAS